MIRPRLLHCDVHGRFMWKGLVDCPCGLRWQVIDKASPRYRDPLEKCTCGLPLVEQDGVESKAILACAQCGYRCSNIRAIEKRAVSYVPKLWLTKDGAVEPRMPRHDLPMKNQ